MAVTYLLQKDYNKGFATVTGDKVNSAGYGLEVSRNLIKELFASLHNSNFTLDYCEIKIILNHMIGRCAHA